MSTSRDSALARRGRTRDRRRPQHRPAAAAGSRKMPAEPTRMPKTLSVKTRRADLSAAEFRRHYEGRHVPLGLGFRHRFGWTRYARNYVVAVRGGEATFDCLTEFWYADAAALAGTRAFARSPEFGVLDEDDRRFLDTGRRLAFEVEERLLAGPPRGVGGEGVRRLAIVLGRPGDVPAHAFREVAAGLGCRLAAAHPDACERVALDLREGEDAGALEMAAIVSLWPRAGSRVPTSLACRDAPGPCAIVELETVETPPEALAR